MSSLQIGPQYYPPRPLGAQVISRGPHGMRFARDPLPKPGGGFMWWNEQSLLNDDYKAPWEPQQKVTGVLGLGSFTSWIADHTPDVIAMPFRWIGSQIDVTAEQRALPPKPEARLPAPPSQPILAPSSDRDAQLHNETRVFVSQSTNWQGEHGNFGEAQRALDMARQSANAIQDPTRRQQANALVDQGQAKLSEQRTHTPQQQQAARDRLQALTQQQQQAAQRENERQGLTPPCSWQNPGPCLKPVGMVALGLLALYVVSAGASRGLRSGSRAAPYVMLANPRRRPRRRRK